MFQAIRHYVRRRAFRRLRYYARLARLFDRGGMVWMAAWTRDMARHMSLGNHMLVRKLLG